MSDSAASSRTARIHTAEKENGKRISDNEAILRLIELSPLDYDRVREDEAGRLGVRVTTLDRAVEGQRVALEASEIADSVIERLQPSSAPVNGAELMDELLNLVRRFVVLPDEASVAIVLWAVWSYAYDLGRICPRLLITSPEKRCGKTTLVELLAGLCHRSLAASNVSPAALFRSIEAWHPTLLIDEADTFLSENLELRGIINSGHTRHLAFVLRAEGEKFEPKKFSTWAPMVLAMIKTPPGTLLDRCIAIQLRRKLPTESVDKPPMDLVDRCRSQRERILRWVSDHADELKESPKMLPPSPNDRALDNWDPLFRVAEVAGADWPERARAAFAHLVLSQEDEDSIGPLILADIRKIFSELNRSRMHSTQLIECLIEIDGRPWADWRRGKSLNANNLSRFLRPFGIHPKQMKIDNTNRNGYELRDFQDAFNRYIGSDAGESL